MKRFLAHLSIRHKLVLVILGTSAFGLLLACGAFVAQEVHSFRRDLLKESISVADMVGYHSTAALTFEHPGEAERTLRSLEIQPNVTMACIYAPDRSIVASYVRTNLTQPPAPSVHRHDAWFASDYLHVFRPACWKATSSARSTSGPI